MELTLHSHFLPSWCSTYAKEKVYL